MRAERLVAADAAGGQLEHGLEDGADRAVAAAQQRLDLAALVGARRAGGEVGARSGGSGGGRRAWRRTGRRRRARAARRPPARRAGRSRRRPSDSSRRRPTSTSASAARARSAASAAASPPTPGRTSTNSSPPRRPTASPARTTERSLAAAAASALSPSAWPCESLMRLKWSRSTTATLSGAPVRAAASISRRRSSCEPRWLSSPVRPSVAAWRRRCSRWRAAS